MTPSTPLGELKGVGPETAKKLKSLGLATAGELIEYYPRAYSDYSHVTPIGQLKPGLVTIKAVIKSATGRFVSRGMHVTEAIAADDTGSVRLVWFKQPYRAAALKSGAEYFVSGEFALRGQRLNIASPSVELVSDLPINTARIVPIYRETKGIKSAQIRKFVRNALPVLRSMQETLPPWLIRREKLISHAQAIETMHFPSSSSALIEARRRLGFEEVFGLTLAALLNKYELLQETAISIPFDKGLAQEFVSHLPFTLTDGQRRCVWQIYQDMQRTNGMNRLVEGDVGSGKTVVAAMAAVMAMRQGFQVALMAPTELLARQHADTLHTLLRPLGLSDQLSLLVGGMTKAQKTAVYRSLKSGTVTFIVGTHALIQDTVGMHKLGLVIIDEQHRFGVGQRKALQAKAGHMPHVLSMTATPIPRSLALTLYGELDISVIDAKPAGRLPIITKIVSPNARAELYQNLTAQLSAGRQMFVVCPLIAESDGLPAKSAEAAYEDMQQSFKNFKTGLLHGKMKPAEKDVVMQQFVRRELDILVSTTVIEVGVNVPNATVMLIENAERFGLAQAHQLRGRVGRSDHQGYCYLMMGDSAAPSKRLRALESSGDGFRLAELDLELRGPGAIYGNSQHGELDLRVATLSDVKLIAAARKSAQEFIDRGDNLLEYKELHERVSKLRAVTNLS